MELGLYAGGGFREVGVFDALSKSESTEFSNFFAENTNGNWFRKEVVLRADAGISGNKANISHWDNAKLCQLHMEERAQVICHKDSLRLWR